MLDFWFNRCERITSSGDYIRELDGLRFLALMMVFLLHLNHAVHGAFEQSGTVDDTVESFSHAMEFGALGVQLFFCISGFILGLPFADAAINRSRRISLKKFYLRRLTRLEPPLIIHITIMLAVYVWFVGKTLPEFLPHYFATITYTHSHIYGFPSPINPMTWSLEVEAQFYLCTPLLCSVFLISSVFWRRFVIVAGIFGFGLIGNALPSTLLPGQLPYFLAGFLLVDFYLVNWKKELHGRKGADWVGVGCVIVFVFLCAFHKSIPGVVGLTAAVMFGFMWAVFRGNWLRRIFRVRFFATLGGMCYTFYLYHLAVITTLFRVLDTKITGMNYFVAYLLCLVVVGGINWLLCSVLFVLFEKPFMRWRPSKGNFFKGILG